MRRAGRRSLPTGNSTLGNLLSNVSQTVGAWFGFGYAATDPRRKIIDPRRMWGTNRATANQLLSSNLPMLRSYCRDLERNNPTARAGVEAVCALVVGTGIALEPDTGDAATDELIRAEWEKLVRHADVDGRDLYTIQTEACRDMVVAGESIWRLVVDADFMRDGGPPSRILCLESEWLTDEIPPTGDDAVSAVAGIRLDKYGKPVTYRIGNPSGGAFEDVPASQIIHVFERRRSLQARGEPWMSPVIETLMNERDLVDAELYAAKQTAAMALVITSEAGDEDDTTDDGSIEDPARSIAIGNVARMLPGEKVEAFSHTRPSQQIAPFRQMLRGDIAAALRIPQRFLDRDVSRANFSSMQADMIDTERLLSPLRELFGHQTAGRLYIAALPYLAMRAGIQTPRTNYRLLPDGQPYINPEKDIAAASAAIAAGLSTHEAEIAKRGGDYRKVWTQLAKENAEAEALDLDLGETKPDAPESEGHAETDAGDDAGEDQAPESSKAENTKSAKRTGTKMDRWQFNALSRQIAELRQAPASSPAPVVVAPQYNVRSEDCQALGAAIGAAIPATVVNVPTQPAPAVSVRNEIAAPIINPTPVTVRNEIPVAAAPVVNVHVDPTPVTIENTVEVPQRTIKATPQLDGSVIMVPQE